MAYSKEEIDLKFDDILNEISGGGLVHSAIEKRMGTATFYKLLKNDAEKSNRYLSIMADMEHRPDMRTNHKGSKAISISDYRRQNARMVNMAKFPNSAFYIFCIPNMGLYKLGVSQNVDRRIRDITNAMPFDVILLYRKSINNAYVFEEYIHNMYKDNFIQNEWFQLVEYDITNIMRECEKWEM